jgi:adenine phosphoribosyltransferase
VLVVDDVIATGGTAKAAVELARAAGANVVAAAFFIELSFLNGSALLPGLRVESLLSY